VLAEVVSTLVRTRSGWKIKRELFLENGGILSYEAPGAAVDDGLVEAGTPECRGPSEAILYQRAQDALVARALPGTVQQLGGELTLLKNCRDAEGHYYGAQENYEAEIARGGWLFAWRAGVVALAPVVAISCLASWAVLAALMLVVLAMVLVVTAISLLPRLERLHDAIHPEGSFLRVLLQRPLAWIERALWEPPMILVLALYRLCAFRELRRGLLPFLISRPIITGAGTLVDDRFALSEKAVAVRRISRWWLGQRGLSIFEPGNLCKRLRGPVFLDFAAFRSLFRRRQRLQIGLSDSNMAQTAEYLKVATTCLVIDLIEAGLRDHPHVRQPLHALRKIVDGDHAHAIALQRSYLAAARRFVEEAPAVPLEVSEVIARWSTTLDAIEHAPSTLIGQLDWITKQALIEKAGVTPDERKKIDLKYHELETGYFAVLEARGLAPILVTPEEAQIASVEPPSTTPARARARLIRDLADVAKVTIGWDRVQIGGRIGGKVIRLDDHRDTSRAGTGTPSTSRAKS